MGGDGWLHLHGGLLRGREPHKGREYDGSAKCWARIVGETGGKQRAEEARSEEDNTRASGL
eukprot:752429-Hanusia_phi.AAC.4